LIKVEGLAAVVDVNRQPVPVVRAFLQLSKSPPRRWTVVPRPRNVPVSVKIGAQYAVCPSCRVRVPLQGRPSRMFCARCSVDFEVAWEENYLTQKM
ncbi:MAG: hypothetical protein ACREME_10125, partial [Gemmatimonadales bacterium]